MAIENFWTRISPTSKTRLKGERYDTYADTTVGSLTHVHSRNAGAITAELYLHEYVKDAKGADVDWVHVDFSATHADNKPGRPIGFGPMGMRAALELIRSKYAKK